VAGRTVTIARLLAGVNPSRPTQELTILVHKAWDVDTELVIMQTGLQVDGGRHRSGLAVNDEQ